MGPNYQRPKIESPAAFRGDDSQTDEASIADTRWSELFKDPVLTDLISTALSNNYDMRIAAERVLQARAQLGVADSDLFPTLDANGTVSSNRNSLIGSNRFLPAGVTNDVSYTQVGFRLGWELDFWGRLRRLRESARAEYLASEDARRGVTTTLVADVTAAYFALREFDMDLDIARKTRDIGDNSLRLTTLRQQRGAATALDVHQAEQLLRTATAQIAASERSIAQQENALSLLLGRMPGDIAQRKGSGSIRCPRRGACRFAIGFARQAARYSRSRTTIDRRQCSDRRSPGAIFPADLADRLHGRTEPSSDGLIHRSRAAMDALSRGRSAGIRCWTSPLEREIHAKPQSAKPWHDTRRRSRRHFAKCPMR